MLGQVFTFEVVQELTVAQHAEAGHLRDGVDAAACLDDGFNLLGREAEHLGQNGHRDGLGSLCHGVLSVVDG